MFEREIAALEDDLVNIKRMIKAQVDQWEGAETADGRVLTEEVLYTLMGENGRCTLESLMLMKSNVVLALAMYKIRQPAPKDPPPMARYCGHQNTDPSYPYRCTKPVGHHELPEPEHRRHGYAGVFWL